MLTDRSFQRILYYGSTKSVGKFDLSKIICIFPNLNFLYVTIMRIGIGVHRKGSSSPRKFRKCRQCLSSKSFYGMARLKICTHTNSHNHSSNLACTDDADRQKYTQIDIILTGRHSWHQRDYLIYRRSK